MLLGMEQSLIFSKQLINESVDNGLWFMPHGSWLKARDSWLMALDPPGPGPYRQFFLGHEP